jgi:hypothetical protein
VRFRVAMPIVAVTVVIAAVALTLAVPTFRGDVLDALHLGDDPAGASPVRPDGRVPGHANLRMAAQPAPPKPTLTAHDVKVNATGFFSWALLDRRTSKIVGTPNYTSGTNTTESMIKSWITSDYLRMLGDKQPTQQRLAELSRMIRDSDDDAAQDIYQVDGGNAVINRMIKTCGLTGSTVYNGWWSRTQVTARDAVRLGLCVADGRAAGPKWTDWVLSEMRQVRGTVQEEPNGGRWGIVDGLPPDLASEVSIKNGWTLIYADGQWHLNCLAIDADWVLAVLTRYPSSLGKQYGANICKEVTQQLLTNNP